MDSGQQSSPEEEVVEDVVGQEPGNLRSFEVTSFYSVYGISSDLPRIAAYMCFFL